MPPATRIVAGRALGHLQEDADLMVPKLIDLLNRKVEGNARVGNCVNGAQVLGLLGPRAKAAVPRLRELAQDDDNEIAAAAEWALSKIEGR
jgi:hypothetical protein